MINHQYQCIFIEIPKTASTSIREIIGHPIKPHLDIGEIRDSLIHEARFSESVNPQQWADDIVSAYFKFTVVRNPWDRVVSLYLRREGIQPSGHISFDEFVERIEYSSDTCIHPSRHRYQLDWLRDKDGEINIDYIARFENIEQHWQEIASRLGIEQALPHINRNETRVRHYTEFYNNNTRQKITDQFAIDIEYFSYSFAG